MRLSKERKRECWNNGNQEQGESIRLCQKVQRV